ncbi:glycosyl hydrolase [Paenibacillaceae bacterium]|nr:glycosyl hydrolase [Paenibacillaceae bacterium]
MSNYFPLEESLHDRQGSSVRKAIEIIANQYVGSTPPNGFIFRTVSKESFRQLEDGRYDINLMEKFPERQLGEFGYACTLVHSGQSCEIELALSCYGPTRVYLNGGLFYKSTMTDDVNILNKRLLQAQLHKGWNIFFIKMVKASSGFGCIFGSSNYKWFPVHGLAPFAERSGGGGWAYSSSVQDLYSEEALPAARSLEKSLPTPWFPLLTGDGGQDCGFEQLFGLLPGQSAYGWSSFHSPGHREALCSLSGEAPGPIQIWVNDTLIVEAEGGSFDASVVLSPGDHSILLLSTCGSNDWSVSVSVTSEGRPCRLTAPQRVKGVQQNWICLGPFSDRESAYLGTEPSPTLYQLFDRSVGGKKESLYWRAPGIAEGYVRPYLENERYAKWNYPLGVTLYGLLQAGRILKREDLLDYVTGHISECTNLYPYSLWDREQYGAPAINHQLVELNMLDDCGSFGSAMLEAFEETRDEKYLTIAHIIADYIMNKQERKEDGVFYRLRAGEYQENTLWADDLYMSTPFLTRYYKQTGNEAAIKEAASQFLLFKKYLYMPERRIVSHVYDFKYNTPTHIPWGRGNGWVLFSLSELLAVMPEASVERGELIRLFNDLASGYLALQGAHGLWHQVLTDASSYEETSCTAMFAYAFCRGVRLGWLQNPDAYADAARKAWEGLTKFSIDQAGNVYGVCRGSGYSFSSDYYKDELNWVLNDTHGIGIVLLCGGEYERMLSSI